jgi:hypothetical protein
MRAPWASAICLTIASPSPLPRVERLRDGSRRKEGSNARVFGDAGDIVVDKNCGSPSRWRHDAMRREVQRVVDQIAEQPPQRHRFGADPERRIAKLGAEAGAGRKPVLDDASQQCPQVDAFALGAGKSAARHRECVFQQPGHLIEIARGPDRGGLSPHTLRRGTKSRKRRLHEPGTLFERHSRQRPFCKMLQNGRPGGFRCIPGGVVLIRSRETL